MHTTFLRRCVAATVVAVAALSLSATAAHASEAVLDIDTSCTGIVTAIARVQSTDGVTGTIDGWWGAALGKPATDTRITVHYPAGTAVTIGVNMTLSTGAPSSAVATVTVPPPCPNPTTTTTPATTVPPTTVPPLPDPTTTVPPTTVAPTTPTWPATTRPTVRLDGRKRPTTTTVADGCPSGQVRTYVPPDSFVCRPGLAELPRTGLAFGWWMPGLAAVLVLLGLGFWLESRGWRNGRGR